MIYFSSSKAFLTSCSGMASSNLLFQSLSLFSIASSSNPAPHSKDFPFLQSPQHSLAIFQPSPCFSSVSPMISNTLLFPLLPSLLFCWLLTASCVQWCPKFRDHKAIGRSMDVWVPMKWSSSSFIPWLQWEADRRMKSQFLWCDPLWAGPLNLLMIASEFTSTVLHFVPQKFLCPSPVNISTTMYRPQTCIFIIALSFSWVIQVSSLVLDK